MDSATHTPDAEHDATKRCPDCAEEVQAGAKVCKHCGYRFDEGSSATTAAARASAVTAAETEAAGRTPKSAPGAAILGLVIAGLGNVYAGETWRGVVYFASLVVAVFAGVVTDTVGPGPLIALIAAVDAYRGAKHYNATGRPRGIGTGVWVVLGLTLALATAGLVIAANDDESAAVGPTQEDVNDERLQQLEDQEVQRQQEQDAAAEDERRRQQKLDVYEQCIAEGDPAECEDILAP